MVAPHCHRGVKPPMHSGSYSRCLVRKPRWAWCTTPGVCRERHLGEIGESTQQPPSLVAMRRNRGFLCAQPQSPAAVCTATLMADRAVGLTPATVSLKSKHTLRTTVEYGVYWNV